MRRKVVIATTNLHKLREIRAILADRLSVDLLSLRDYPNYVAPEETGADCQANVLIKGCQAAEQLGEWVLADDSALVVPALGGEPGVFSARYAGVGASDRDHRRKLLERMISLADLQRSAYFECWLALVSPEGEVKTVRGLCEGEILLEEVGGNGFGYDPIFRKNGYSKSMAQLAEDVKNRISHRAQAVDKIIPHLERIAL